MNLPELALVRFVVLDDEYIGDEFIGQYTIPFECLQPGKLSPLHSYPYHYPHIIATPTSTLGGEVALMVRFVVLYDMEDERKFPNHTSGQIDQENYGQFSIFYLYTWKQ